MMSDHSAHQAGLANAIAAQNTCDTACRCLQRHTPQRFRRAIVQYGIFHIQHHQRPK